MKDFPAEGAARDYANAILALPAVQARGVDAGAESKRIERFDL